MLRQSIASIVAEEVARGLKDGVRDFRDLQDEKKKKRNEILEKYGSFEKYLETLLDAKHKEKDDGHDIKSS